MKSISAELRGAACTCGKLQAAPKALQVERQGEQLGNGM